MNVTATFDRIEALHFVERTVKENHDAGYTPEEILALAEGACYANPAAIPLMRLWAIQAMISQGILPPPESTSKQPENKGDNHDK